MKVITFDDIEKLKIDACQCFDWTEQMIRNKKNTILPPKISMKPLDGTFCNVMPSIIPQTGISAVSCIIKIPIIAEGSPQSCRGNFPIIAEFCLVFS